MLKKRQLPTTDVKSSIFADFVMGINTHIGRLMTSMRKIFRHTSKLVYKINKKSFPEACSVLLEYVRSK